MKENKARNLVLINIKYVEYFAFVKERVSICTWWRMSNDSRVCGCSNNKISIEDMGVLKSCIICKEY